jgi:hypothetical protein
VTADRRELQETWDLLEDPVSQAFKDHLVSLVHLVNLEPQEDKDLKVREETLAMQDSPVNREPEETMVHQVRQASVVSSGLLAQPDQQVALDRREKRVMLVKEVRMVLREVPVHEVPMDRLVHLVRPVPQATSEMQVHQDQPGRQGLEVTQDRLVIREVVENRDLLDRRDLVELLERQVYQGHRVNLVQGEKMDLQDRRVSADHPAHQDRMDL